MKRNIVCLVCPRGCHLDVEQIDDKITVQGNFCQKGIPYAHAEMKHPERVLTTTVVIEGAREDLVPLKSARALPKDKLMEAMAVLKNLKLQAPVHCGDVAYADILGTGVDMLVTRSIGAE
jgi:CxxC motif-containing protein